MTEQMAADSPAREARRDAILAIDIGCPSFEAGLVTFRGDLLDRSRVEVETDVGPQSHFAALARIVLEQLDQARDQHDVRVRAIGVSCPGPIERNCETVSPISVPSWRRFTLREHLHELTGLPVFGDLDAKAMALSEGWLGAARGATSFAAITVSTGIGGGLVLDGDLVDGATGNAGHIGHIIVEPGGRRCGCGARGCLEAEASGLAVATITGRPHTEPTYDIMRRPAAWSAGPPAWCAPRSTSTSSSWAAVSRSGSQRRSSTPLRRRSTPSPGWVTARPPASPRCASARPAR